MLQQSKGWKWEVGIGEDDARRIWKEYFEDLYNIDTEEQVAVHMCALPLMGFREVAT